MPAPPNHPTRRRAQRSGGTTERKHLMFDSYETALIAYAACVDEVLSNHRGTDTIDTPLLWADSFTARMVTALTEDDEELRGRACTDWDPDDEDAPDADTIREGIIERITDDILCEMPEGYQAGYDPATGAPTLVWVGAAAGGL